MCSLLVIPAIFQICMLEKHRFLAKDSVLGPYVDVFQASMASYTLVNLPPLLTVGFP